MGAKLIKRRNAMRGPAGSEVPALDSEEFTLVCFAAGAALCGDNVGGSVNPSDPPPKRMADAVMDHCGADRAKAKAIIERYVALQPMLKMDLLAPFREDELPDGSARYHKAVFAAGASAPLKSGRKFDELDFLNCVFDIAEEMDGVVETDDSPFGTWEARLIEDS